MDIYERHLEMVKRKHEKAVKVRINNAVKLEKAREAAKVLEAKTKENRAKRKAAFNKWFDNPRR